MTTDREPLTEENFPQFLADVLDAFQNPQPLTAEEQAQVQHLMDLAFGPDEPEDDGYTSDVTSEGFGDDDLPGMWSRSDFEGGRDEVRGPDWKRDA